ncbi:hypothetical protein AN958_03596, partial [Leucoagaricus sp. SymC.cos]
HDWVTDVISAIVVTGISTSYLPQHYRIIKEKSSVGLNPLFLLLGSTSAAAGMWNMITMQWGVARCCSTVSWGSCAEMTAGIFQVFVQWFCFTLIFALYIKYYPEHLKYDQFFNSLLPQSDPTKSSQWRLSLLCAWVSFWHFMFCATITIYLMMTATPVPIAGVPLPAYILLWATFLGVSAAILATIQYAPQLIYTYQLKLVGALSIPMMCINAPGSVFMIASIALRPDTNWTSWFTFLVGGIMQGILLLMCLILKLRQRRLGIDDFGNSIVEHGPVGSESSDEERRHLIRK